MARTSRTGFGPVGRSGGRRGRAGAGWRRGRRAPRPAFLRELEPRIMLSTFTVTDTLDDSNQGSLRSAITQVDGDPNPGVDTIDFAIPGTGPFTISPSSPLPTITHSVLIDGCSQSGAVANSQADRDNAVLMIDLNGSMQDLGGYPYGDGLDILAGGVRVRGQA